MKPEVIVLRWVGDIDLDCCEQVMAEIDSTVAAEGHSTLVLDLSEVGWVDSIGLGALIHARNRTVNAQMSLLLRSVPPKVKRLITSAGMRDLFTFDDPHPVDAAPIHTLPQSTRGLPVADPTFDQIAELARTMLNAPVGLFTQVDQDKQVMPGASGLDAELNQQRSTPLRNSMCHFVVARAAPVVVPDAAADPLFSTHPAHLENGVASYLGMPVTDLDGSVIGSLCVIDTSPRSWTADEIEHLRLLADRCSAEVRSRTAAQQAVAATQALHAAHAAQRKIFSTLVSASLLLTDAVSSVTGSSRVSVQSALQRVDSALAASRSLVLDFEGTTGHSDN